MPQLSRIERGQHAVCADAGFDVRGRGRAISGVEMFFLAIERQLHRRLRRLRETRAEDPFGADLRLAAEAATHVLGDHANVGLRNFETVGELLRGSVDGLRGDPRGQLVTFPLAHDGMAFHADVRDDMRCVSGFDGLGGLREAGVQDRRSPVF